MNIYIKDYIKDLRSLNFSPQTIDSYSRHLNRFAKFANDIEPKDITVSLVDSYRTSLQANKPSTVNYSLITIRTFLKYLARKQVATLPSEAIQLSKTDQPETNFLEENEVAKLLSSIKTKTYTGKRDKAIIEILLATGLRVSELTNLKIAQINFSRQDFTLRGKGGKLRIGFLNEDATRALKTYLRLRSDTNKYLFVTNHATTPSKMAPRSIQRLLSKYIKQSRIDKRVSPHTLRHTFATNLLRKTNNLKIVGDLLGHVNVNTTSRYVHLTNNDLKQAYFS